MTALANENHSHADQDAMDQSGIERNENHSHIETLDGGVAVATTSKRKGVAKANGIDSHLNQPKAKVAPVARGYDFEGNARAIMSELAAVPFKRVAEARGVTTVELWSWIRHNPERLAQYQTAQEAKAHVQIDEAHALADRVVEGEIDPKRAQQKIQLTQWAASKTRAYADKQTIEHTGTVTLRTVSDDDLADKLGAIMSAVGARVPLTLDHDDATTDQG